MTAANDGGGLRPALPFRWQVAIHEAAHAVYARKRALTVVRVSVEGIVAIENGAEIEDRDENGVRLGVCSYVDSEIPDALPRCVLSLVGPAAAHKAGSPRPLPPYGDFVAVAETRHPESDEGKVLHELRRVDDPGGLYEAARSEAEAFVHDRWSEIVKLAESLMEAESLDEEDVELVFDPTWPEFQRWLDEVGDTRCPWFIAEQEAEGEDYE